MNDGHSAMNMGAKVFVAGHRGLVGAAILRRMQEAGFQNLLCRARAELDLTDQRPVADFFASERPEIVFLAAAKVGGIHANATYPAEFIRDNLAIQTNVIDAAYRNGASKLVFLGSSCVYPKHAPQPMREECLLSGPLEPTNEPYAVAKIAGIKMCEAYRRQYGFNAITLMPANLYGPGDNFNLETAHVLPALMRRFHDAKLAGAPEITVWGTGTPKREFLHVDDLADAALFLTEHYDDAPMVNVGVGEDLSILALTEAVRRVVGYEGAIALDSSRPDGTPRKLLDNTRLRALGWRPKIPLEEGLRTTYAWFLEHQSTLRN